jgi:ribosomal protein L30E
VKDYLVKKEKEIGGATPTALPADIDVSRGNLGGPYYEFVKRDNQYDLSNEEACRVFALGKGAKSWYYEPSSTNKCTYGTEISVVSSDSVAVGSTQGCTEPGAKLEDRCIAKCPAKSSEPALTTDEIETILKAGTLALNFEEIKKYVNVKNEKCLSYAKAANADNWTVLHAAARLGNFDMVVYLIASGADPTATTKSTNLTVLHDAATSGDLDVVKYLIKKGADPKAKTKSGSTVLHLAAYGNNSSVDLVRYLVEDLPEKLRLNPRDTTDIIPFSRASDYAENSDVKKYLLDKENETERVVGNSTIAGQFKAQ